jgi:hypothetical protein
MTMRACLVQPKRRGGEGFLKWEVWGEIFK